MEGSWREEEKYTREADGGMLGRTLKEGLKGTNAQIQAAEVESEN